MLNVKRIHRIQLAAVGTGGVKANAVNQHDDRAAAHIHAVVGASLAADVDAGDQLRQHVFKFFSALNLLFNFLAFDNPGGLGHFSDGAVRSVCADDHAVISGPGGQGGCQQQWVKHPETLVHAHSFYEFMPLILQVAGVLTADYSAHPWASPLRGQR